MSKSIGRFTLVLALVGFTAACGGVGPEERSGRDTVRGGAQDFPLERAVTDAVNHEGGDATDWKVFEAPASGVYTFEFYWDNPYVEAVVNLHDGYGTLLETLTHQVGSGEDIVEYQLPESGLFYLRIHAQQYRTTYSIRVTQGRLEQEADDGPQEDPMPEFDRPI